MRFEVGYYSLKPDIKVIAPWREWDLNSRTKLLAYAEENGIPVPMSKRNEPPFSMDANLLHISYEGNALEDPWAEPAEDMFTRSVSPEQAPDVPTYVEVGFEKGDPVSVDGERMSPATLLTKLNSLAGDNGIGRVDIVESRFVGMKSRGVYETPGGTILLTARRAMESITLDRGEAHLKVSCRWFFFVVLVGFFASFCVGRATRQNTLPPFPSHPPPTHDATTKKKNRTT